MIIGLILILLATFFMFEIFQSLRDLDIAQATTIHYVNISEPLPQIPNDTLTSSIRRRINEVYGIPEIGLDATIHDITANFNPKIMNFYKEYMRIQVHKLSHIQLFNDQDSTLRLFTLNSRWSRSKPYTDFALHTLREERLYQINPKEAPKSHRRVWKHGFYQRVNGIVEAVSSNKEHDVIAAAVYDPLNKSRSLLYFNKLKYGYGKSMSTMDFSELYEDRYALGIDSNVNYEGYQDFASILGADDEDLNKLYEFNVYDTIPIEEDEKIENIAVSDGLIIYTTVEERMKLKYMLKTDNATWITKTFEYPITPVRYRIHKNIGINFIFNAQTGEKQLLLTDLVANETDAQLIYYIFQPVQGSSLMHDEGARYPYLVNNTDNIDREKIYGTKSFEICRVNIPKELASIDVLSNFPRSIIKSNAATRQIIVVSLKKYVILISMESYKERSPPYQIKHFEDQEYKIKDVSIAEDGTYFSFLTYNKDREKVFIIQSKAANAPPDNKLYLVAFDYSVSHNNAIKETQIVKSRSNEPVLQLLLETGEVATFSLELGVMTWHGLRGLGAGDELDFLSLFSVALIIIIFIIAKIASSTRININLQRPR